MANEIKDAKGFIDRYAGMTSPSILSFLKKSNLISRTSEHIIKDLTPRTLAKDFVQVDVPRLRIATEEFNELRNIRPDKVKVAAIEISMRFGYAGDNFFSNVTTVIESACADPRYFNFHFDTVPERGDHRFPHPSHHFQFGGENLAKFGFDQNEAFYGRLLFMDTPRFAFPPMDLSLTLHFLLSNFLASDKYSPKSVPAFEQQLIAAQKYLWNPFFSAIASYWSQGKNDAAKRYLPQLIG